MRKSQTTAFLLLLFYIGKFILCQKTYLEKLQFILLHLHYRFFTRQVIENVVTPTPIQILIGFVDPILRSQILGKRLGILIQILIAMDDIFYLYILEKYLQFMKKIYINLGNQFHYKKYNERDQNISKTFVFVFHHSI